MSMADTATPAGVGSDIKHATINNNVSEKPPQAMSKENLQKLHGDIIFHIGDVSEAIVASNASANYWLKHSSDPLEIPSDKKPIDFLIDMCNADAHRAQTQGMAVAAKILTDDEFIMFLQACFDFTDYNTPQELCKTLRLQYTEEIRKRIDKACSDQRLSAMQQESETVETTPAPAATALAATASAPAATAATASAPASAGTHASAASDDKQATWSSAWCSGYRGYPGQVAITGRFMDVATGVAKQETRIIENGSVVDVIPAQTDAKI